MIIEGLSFFILSLIVIIKRKTIYRLLEKNSKKYFSHQILEEKINSLEKELNSINSQINKIDTLIEQENDKLNQSRVKYSLEICEAQKKWEVEKLDVLKLLRIKKIKEIALQKIEHICNNISKDKSLLQRFLHENAN